MITAVYSIIIFLLVILIHEIGHFIAAKLTGINVEEFSIGMGPVILKRKKDETTYFIKAFPIGGYVKMEGEDEEISSEKSFNAKSIKERFFVIFMGPFMNFFLALIIFITLNLIYGMQGTTIEIISEDSAIAKQGIQTNDKIIKVNNKRVFLWEEIIKEIDDSKDQYNLTIKRENSVIEYTVEKEYKYIIGISSKLIDEKPSNVIEYTTKDSPAEIAGMQDNDIIIAIDGKNIENWEDITKNIFMSEGKAMRIVVLRDDSKIELNVTPVKQLLINYYTYIEKNIIQVIIGAFFKIVFYISLLINVIIMLIMRTISTDVIAGPVGIISMVGEAAKYGPYALMTIAAFININLGFFNLLPIPALDGSRIMFLLLELVRGKKISDEKEKLIHLIGFVFLLLLMSIIIYKDILKLFR